MSHKVNVRTRYEAMEAIIPATGNDLAGLASAAVANTSIEDVGYMVKKAKIRLTAFDVEVLASNDFGGAQIMAFANTNILILGAKADLAVTVSGGITNAEDIDVGVGTVITAGITTGALDEGDEIINEYSAVGAAATGTADAHSFANATPALIFLDAGTIGVFLNVEVPIATDGNALFTGDIEIFYIDLGKPAA